jgi:hypothetical protein
MIFESSVSGVKPDLRPRLAYGEIAAFAAAFAPTTSRRKYGRFVDGEVLEVQRPAGAAFVPEFAAANADAFHARPAKRQELLQVHGG